MSTGVVHEQHVWVATTSDIYRVCCYCKAKARLYRGVWVLVDPQEGQAPRRKKSTPPGESIIQFTLFQVQDANRGF